MALNPRSDDMSRGYVDGVDMSRNHVDKMQFYRHIAASTTRLSVEYMRAGAFIFSATSLGKPAGLPLSAPAFFTHSCSVCAVLRILAGDRRDRRPSRGMLAFVIQNHPHGSGADFRSKLVRCLAHSHSTVSKVGASGKSGGGSLLAGHDRQSRKVVVDGIDNHLVHG